VNTGKVVANAGSHRILYALSFGSCTSKELKNIVGAINSLARFDGEYMERLVSNGFVKRFGEGWLLTPSGEEKLEELGPARGVRRRNGQKHQLLMDRPNYDPKMDMPPPMRPGAEDFLKYPSRVGNYLYYRDGRVEQVKGE